jgi:hypothetical protein
MSIELVAGALAVGGVSSLAFACQQLRRHRSGLGDARRLRYDWTRATKRNHKDAERRGQHAVQIVSRFREQADHATTALARNTDPLRVFESLEAEQYRVRTELAALAFGIEGTVRRPDPRAYQSHRPVQPGDAARLVEEIRAWMEDELAAIHDQQAVAHRQLQALEAVCVRGDYMTPAIEAMFMDLMAGAADLIVRIHKAAA